ncbi:MAG: hypothetical protein ACFBZ9_01035 [Sphingomonadales bacterium]
MLDVMLIDDNKTEAVFWRHMQNRYYADKLSVRWFGKVESALEHLKSSTPDVIVLDDKIPPHDSSQFALDQIKAMGFPGKVVVWSNRESSEIRNRLRDHVDVPVVSKGDYLGRHLRKFIEPLLEDSAAVSEA